MKASTILGRASVFLAHPAILATVLLYTYPFFLGCSFPQPTDFSAKECLVDNSTFRNVSESTGKAPFRLLALGDPQLEGDSSLGNPNDPLFPSIEKLREVNWHYKDVRDVVAILESLKDLLIADIPRFGWSLRKRLDLVGNDYYLGHIYRTLHWWLEPTHIAVLGDLLGSQWVETEEFESRSWRYWNRVFRHGRRVDDSIMNSEIVEPLGLNPVWRERVINIVGNHDIGYAGDIDRTRVERFERAFGKVNWDIKFQLPKQESSTPTSENISAIPAPELRLVILNNMNLDSPALDPSIQLETYEFINDRVIKHSRPVEDRTAATILLTHVPLHKERGVCTDGEFFDYGPHGVREQNHLSEFASEKAILEGIFGMGGTRNMPADGFGRNGLIINGHDHEGCDVLHYVVEETDKEGASWNAKRWVSRAEAIGEAVRGIREITVRSMMGSYGGNAGLVSAWFDKEIGEWRFEYDTCALGVQHIWWAVHVLDLITLLSGVAALVLMLIERSSSSGVNGIELSSSTTVNQPIEKTHMNGNAKTTGRLQGSVAKRRKIVV